MPLKAVILIGGPQKGTRFRPLSFEVPKPLFPVAGVPMVQHHIEACAKVPGMKEILLMGFYQPHEALSRFLVSAQQEFKIPIRYLQEYAALGTGGGIYHFRDQILSGGAEAFFVLNADVCSEFPLQEMLEFRQQHGDAQSFVILGTTANRTQALNYGCIVANADTQEVQHYVEKPSTFVSEIINCGIYLFTPAIFQHIGEVFQRNQQELVLEESSNGWQRAEVIRLEQDVFTALAGSGKLYVYKTDGFWSQIKSAGSAIYASRLYLNQYSKSHPERLAQNKPGGPIIRGTPLTPAAALGAAPHGTGEKWGGSGDPWAGTSPDLRSECSCEVPPLTQLPSVAGNVYIHPTASIDSTAVLGPNVSIGEGVTVGAGVRVRESIVLHGASLHDHTCVLNTIVGWDSTIGRWARVEGTPSDPNPNDPYAKIDSETLFRDGRLTPSITILGCSVTIPAEVVILNSIVLPHKELSRSYKNQIIL
ncbi:mannose-1-phosphate guanylyltransferase regulatory subunit alpha isoform X3 [Larus michahellis]|uniref:mannose-1-phosphate guanylyltransferase regulatory subunit alpha isoform X3 n=1 Tax=Larus michahellis TaxID=119627 RepID=UPI003D9B4687